MLHVQCMWFHNGFNPIIELFHFGCPIWFTLLLCSLEFMISNLIKIIFDIWSININVEISIYVSIAKELPGNNTNGKLNLIIFISVNCSTSGRKTAKETSQSTKTLYGIGQWAILILWHISTFCSHLLTSST